MIVKKSDKYHASKNTVKRRKPATGLKLHKFLENREKNVFDIIYIIPYDIIYFKNNYENTYIKKHTQ